MSVYLTPERVPELSGFSKGQRRFIWREAQFLLDREDPWFRPLNASLATCAAGFFSYAGFSFGSPLYQLSGFWVLLTVLIAFTAIPAGVVMVAWGHILASRLRPLFREVIQKRGSELDAMA